jgi:hypothetical protein
MYIMAQRIKVLLDIRCHFATLYLVVTNASICVAFYSSNAQKRNACKYVGRGASNAYMDV